MGEVHKGTVTYINKKRFYSLITDHTTRENIFFHGTALCNGEFEDLRCGMEVEYMQVRVPKGNAAIGVIIL